MNKWTAAVAAVVGLIVAAIVVLMVASPDERDSVIFGGSDEPGTLDPQGIDWGEQARIAWCVYDSLVRFGPDDQTIAPGLATHWKASEDGLTWDFTLREGVWFHDGTKFDAEAVKFAFERTRPDHPYAPPSIPYLSSYKPIQSIEVVGPSHVRFHLSEPSAVFLPNLAMFSGGIPSPTAVKKAGADAYAKTPVGTGPYRVAEWRPDEKIVLERFPDYWGARPAVERVIVLPIKDPAARVQRLINGEIDIIDNVSLADLQHIEADPRLAVSSRDSMNVCYLGFNWNVHPWSDLNFRRAVAHAIDRDKLIKTAYFGRAEPAVSIVPPSIHGHFADAPTYPHDVSKAREYLAKVPNLPDTVDLWHMSYSREYVPSPMAAAESLKGDLEEIGLRVTLHPFDRSAYAIKIHEAEHPMILLGWSTDNADADNFLYTLLHADSIPNDGNNVTYFNHPEFNRLTKQAQSETDDARRMELYAEAQRLYAEQLPSIPLVHVRKIAAYNKTRVLYDVHPIETRLYTIGKPK